MTEAQRIRPRERDAIIQSLRAGVVPRVGQHHIQVGRLEEVKALLQDIERVADGGSGIRFVVGEYGSGKTFFLFLIRSIALEKKLVTVHADLTPDRRLQATGGQARSLYAELMRSMATRAKSDGAALPTVVERFISSALTDARTRGIQPQAIILERLAALSELVGGYDFSQVVAAYWRAHETGNEALKSAAVQWLRGEFSTRTDARQALGVRSIIDDDSFYDHLKLMARFVRLAGFGGLLVCLDELVNLYKIANTQARSANYEQILRILNDCLQGAAVGLGFLLGATPDTILDTRRGLYSYQALQSRLAENRFATGGMVDLSGPVINLANLTPEDVFVLLCKLRHVYSSGDPSKQLLADSDIQSFMAHCSKRIGDAYFRTPRNTIKAFLDILAVLDQNPGVSVGDLIGRATVSADQAPDAQPSVEETGVRPPSNPPAPGAPARPVPSDDDLTSFKL